MDWLEKNLNKLEEELKEKAEIWLKMAEVERIIDEITMYRRLYSRFQRLQYYSTKYVSTDWSPLIALQSKLNQLITELYQKLDKMYRDMAKLEVKDRVYCPYCDVTVHINNLYFWKVGETVEVICPKCYRTLEVWYADVEEDYENPDRAYIVLQGQRIEISKKQLIKTPRVRG